MLSRVLAPSTGPPQGPFPPAALFVAAIRGTTTPSDARCRALTFTIGLYEARDPDDDPGSRASRVPLLSVHACCALYPAETCRESPDSRAADMAFAVT